MVEEKEREITMAIRLQQREERERGRRSMRLSGGREEGVSTCNWTKLRDGGGDIRTTTTMIYSVSFGSKDVLRYETERIVEREPSHLGGLYVI